MTTEIVQQYDHKLYRNEIDALYSVTSESAAAMLQLMQMKGHVNRLLFSVFYKNFANLFFQTSKSKHMADEKDLVDEIWKWLDHKNPITDRRAVVGIDLFWRWGRALEKRGIHTIST